MRRPRNTSAPILFDSPLRRPAHPIVLSITRILAEQGQGAKVPGRGPQERVQRLTKQLGTCVGDGHGRRPSGTPACASFCATPEVLRRRTIPSIDNEFLAIEALGFAPRGPVSRRVGCIDRFGDDAFEPEFARMR